eukprot:TRINITY_DN4650_c0_g1_i1.p1 TRINITY_DN4650_c0_g1~~TRINITY_DN4650_c0_g1_i1.p1  ORF type:complete len:512 (-),score=166.55 TRINITY_DN4650_c0_g1_i1:62-1426(-)
MDHFDPQFSMCEQDLANLEDWGFNIVRLGLMWPGVQLSPTEFNMTYLQTMRELVDNMAKHNIYVLLDCHQDLFSPFFCGEGAPDWAVHVPNNTATFPFPAVFKDIPRDPKTGYPEVKVCLELVKTFAKYYFAEATGEAFASLYSNVDGVQTHFAAYWEKVASVFADAPNVIGYEIINEPWPGNVIKDPSLLLPGGKPEKELLQPMYEKVHEAIRKVDNEKIIFYEPTVDNIGHVGFTQGPGGPAYNDRQALSYHIYCGDVDKANDPRSQIFCDFQDDFIFAERIKDLQRLQTAGMMTEFGANWNDTAGLEGMRFVMDEGDKFYQSYIYWQFKSFHDITTASGPSYEGFYGADGHLQTAKVATLARTYAPSINGEPKDFMFVWNTGELELSYIVGNSSAPTELYLSKQFHYPNGFNVFFTPANAATFSHPSNNTVIINHTGVQPGDQLTVHVTRN